MLDVPRHGVALPYKPPEASEVPSSHEYHPERAWDAGATTRARTAPAYTARKNLKTKHDMMVATGHKDPPAPGGDLLVPSFAREAKESNRGAVFGHKLPDAKEIARKLGVFDGPAPGGDGPLPSFVRENKAKGRGVAFLPPDQPSVLQARTLERTMRAAMIKQKPMRRRLGRHDTHMTFEAPYPPTKEETDVFFDPDAPQPHYATAPSFTADNVRENKGVVFGSSRPPFFKKRDITPAPGGNVKVPSFVEDAKRENKGVRFGHRLKSRRDVEERLGIPQIPGVGSYDVETKVTQLGGADQTLWGHAGSRVKKVFDRATT